MLVAICVSGCDEANHPDKEDAGHRGAADVVINLPDADPSFDVLDSCESTCVEVYALAYSLESGCLLSSEPDIPIGCLPLSNPCEEEFFTDRACYISPELDAIFIWPDQVTHGEILNYLKSELGWVRCEEKTDQIQNELEYMFPVCE